ncbi:MAG: O-antigen ligase family protein [Acidobacteria bacterium]|nr:O-antigen ligase family protein [Acidobacteriota bacterium]
MTGDVWVARAGLAAPWLAGGSAVAILFSIAAAQILLGAAILALMVARSRWRFPAIGWPVVALLIWTLVAMGAAGELRAGWPQLKKFFVFAEFAVIATACGTVPRARAVLMAMAGAGTLSALWSFVQFGRRNLEAVALHEDFYTYYTPRRTTGFMSHWMTFSGELVVVLGVLVALAFWANRSVTATPLVPGRWAAIFTNRWAALGLAAVAAVALVLNQTRSIWLAAAAVVVYLVAAWQPRWLLALPVLAVAGYLASPEAVQERVRSIVEPHGETDSNQHRAVTRAAGIEMISAHPLFGLGPEMPGKRFLEFVPKDMLPLPVGYYGHLHNLYLQLAAERGLPALAVLLWLFAALVRGAGQQRDLVLRHAAVAAVIATAVGGLFEYNLGNSEVLHIFLAVTACGFAVAEPVDRRAVA